MIAALYKGKRILSALRFAEYFVGRVLSVGRWTMVCFIVNLAVVAG